jgi:hypothetical protein
MMIKDFKCPNKHVTERFVGNHVTMTPCQECMEQATNIITGTSFRLPGNDPSGFPTAHAAWNKKRNQHMKLEKARES